ncbi:hypothetical protein F2P56_023241 [Juglans regia]|uniref:Uncharacterized protein LOC109021469 isoform X2 n=2 Tax=Juglans regia TaxID=51240 RepID=A0A2I4HU29_JUGRE|nr:uncharacterized protein LOC109021469 isoform X2 [Juglans regia]KAF5459282.1 hypothetical protein F2P56_023241 [Juglans regia]
MTDHSDGYGRLSGGWAGLPWVTLLVINDYMGRVTPKAQSIRQRQACYLGFIFGDELVAVYRYFRSLAVDSPSSTMRYNLIVAFQKLARILKLTTQDIDGH